MQFTAKVKIHIRVSPDKPAIYEVRLGGGKTASKRERIALTSKQDIARI